MDATQPTTTELAALVQVGLETGRACAIRAEGVLYDEVASIRTGMAALLTLRTHTESLEAETARLNRDFAALRIEHSQQADTVERLRAFVESVEFEMGQLLTLATHVQDKDKVVINAALITRKLGTEASTLLAEIKGE